MVPNFSDLDIVNFRKSTRGRDSIIRQTRTIVIISTKVTWTIVRRSIIIVQEAKITGIFSPPLWITVVVLRRRHYIECIKYQVTSIKCGTWILRSFSNEGGVTWEAMVSQTFLIGNRPSWGLRAVSLLTSNINLAALIEV